jgi:hypothetical protein
MVLSGVLNQDQPRVLALDFDSRRFGWRLTVKPHVRVNEIVE